MIAGDPLEDARHLAQGYSHMRQEAETQAAVVSRRQAWVREFPTPENVAKLQAAEAKKQELKVNLAILGKESSAALTPVDAQQQRLTFHRLLLVDAQQQSLETVEIVYSPVFTSENGSAKMKYFLPSWLRTPDQFDWIETVWNSPLSSAAIRPSMASTF
ncbi:SH3 domain-containing protein 3 [Fagus crenata]